MVPWADPSWYQNFASPYYNDDHRAWRAKCRAFMEEHVLPFVHDWSDS